jgi:2-polyprenyl-6-methoxyphenol hydroxylase-like FAD-dependent oxidoreductase
LARFPERFVVLGDAVCSFNPVYGQGMTAGALAAATLAECLAQRRSGGGLAGLDGFSRGFQQKLAPVVKRVWMLATGEDFRWPQTEGGRPDRLTRFMHRYADRVTQLATTNEEVARTFVSAMHLVSPPSALFRPGIVGRVAALAVATKLRAGDHPTAQPQPARRPAGG